MTVPVWVEEHDGRFTASLLASPAVRAEGGSKGEAVAALVSALTRGRRGELVYVTLPGAPPSGPPLPPCTPEEAEAWRQVVADIYRERDDQKRQEFGE